MNPGQQTQAATAGNRITFTSQPLPNGSVGISGSHHHSGTGPTIISTSQLPNTTTIKTITSSASSMGHQSVTQQVQHHQVMQQSQNAQQQSQPQQQSVGASQTQTLVIKSNHAVSLPAGLVSSSPGIVTMTKTVNQVFGSIDCPVADFKVF